MEWVYIRQDDDEPTVFEAEGSRETSNTGLDATSQVSEEPEYYGDDIDEVLIPPEKAFAHLSECLLAQSNTHDSDAGHVTESRANRLARIQRELDALATEPTGDTANGIDTIKALRGQLNTLESATPQPVVITDESSTIVGKGTADTSRISDLERRVALLERVVGPSLESAGGVNDQTISELVTWVREKLALIDDEQATERLRQDAVRIANALQNVPDRNAVQAGALLAKMDEWQHVAATVPTVVARLRSLKRVQDEAAGFVNAVDALTTRYDELSIAAKDNRALLEQVRSTMESNLEVMLGNVRALEERMDKLIGDKHVGDTR